MFRRRKRVTVAQVNSIINRSLGIEKRYCEDCTHFKGRETEVSSKFIDPNHKSTTKLTTVRALSVKERIKMCHHDSCFTRAATGRFEHRKTKSQRVRIQGQAQLNPEGKCTLYNRKVWKFWVSP